MARQKVGQILIQSLSLREARGGNFAAAGMAICMLYSIAKHAGKLSYSSFAYDLCTCILYTFQQIIKYFQVS